MSRINPSILQNLNSIIESGISDYPIPMKKGNSIRIKNAVVRSNKYGHHVFDLKAKRHIGYSNHKTTAVAMAHCVAHNKEEYLLDIARLDHKLSKYYNDAVFYKHSMEKTNDDDRYEAIQMRYEIALDECYRLKEQIETFIFDK